MKRIKTIVMIFTMFAAAQGIFLSAQTSSNTSPEKLKDGDVPANGRYDLVSKPIIIPTGGTPTEAQTGGTYEVTKTVIANGGGSSAAGQYSVIGTAGQTTSGQSSGGNHTMQTGFWAFDLSLTAANVSISGKVLTTNGRGLRNALVLLTEQSGQVYTARTGPFGYYRFEAIEVGQIVILSVRSKQFQFTPRVLYASEDLFEINLVPDGKSPAADVLDSNSEGIKPLP